MWRSQVIKQGNSIWIFLELTYFSFSLKVFNLLKNIFAEELLFEKSHFNGSYYLIFSCSIKNAGKSPKKLF
jgi:hypothetical protein